jgi:hypothetical protein
MKVLLADIDAKVGTEGIIKPRTANESSTKLVMIMTFKNLKVNSTMVPHRDIHKCNWTPPDTKTHNHIDYILLRHSSVLYVR